MDFRNLFKKSLLFYFLQNKIFRKMILKALKQRKPMSNILGVERGRNHWSLVHLALEFLRISY